MHILTLYQSVSRWFLLLTIVVSLAACGGDSSRIDNDNEGSGSDPISPETDASYRINVELRDLDTDELIINPNPEEPVSVQVAVKLDNGDPVASDNISVSTTLGKLTPESGIVKTDDSGVATLELNLEGQEVGGAGEIVVAYDNVSTDQAPYSPLKFSVEEPSLQLGYLDSNNQFVSEKLEILTQNLSSRGSTPVNVFVQGPDGDLYPKRMEVVFSSNCSLSQPAVASLDSPVTTTEGKATSTYTAKGCEGEDSITAALAAYPSITANGQLNVMSPEVGSIEFVSAEPKIISIRGSGGKERSTLLFKVLSKDDLPLSGVEVDFALSTDGNASLVSNPGTTNAAGEVSVLVSSGTVAKPVLVTASIIVDDGEPISTVSSQLVISTGIPDQNSFSVVASSLNPGGDSFDGATSTISVSAGDLFNNPVPDGTAITFWTEYGNVKPSCTTVDGNCSVDWISQNPRQPDFYTFTDDDGKLASLRTIFNTICPVPDVPRGVPCPQLLGQPYGARSSILAFAMGQENFDDANGNGQFDTGEEFIDLPEAFLDKNEDCVFRNNSDSYDPSCLEETLQDGSQEAGDEDRPVPLSDNGLYNKGNGIYNGVLCSDAAEAEGTCSKQLVHVRNQVTVLVAGDVPYGGIFEDEETYLGEANINIPVEGSDKLYFYLSDKYNGRLPLGTTIKTESDHCDVKPESAAVANTNAFGPSKFDITINAPDGASPGDSGFVTIEVNVPPLKGSSGTGFTKAWQFKCITN